ncbi:MAG: metallophosphoesterase [Clostridia bacterium]|nr:metallophosphoesterase [Clostridia bacterium]
MVYVTGDMHGDLSHLKGAPLKKGDTLLVCGDFGFIWYGDKRDAAALRALSRKKYTVLFVDGVHENYDLLANYPLVEFGGAPAWQIAPNVYRLCRGEVYTVEGRTIFAFGGGEEPFEKSLRADTGSYYDCCMPSEEELRRGREALEAVDNRVDFIVTHTPSAKAGAYTRTRRKHETGLGVYFNVLEEAVTYKRWFFGCLHLDRKVSARHLAVYRAIVPLD